MKKRILVAPLNWGIGHATRCIPIIKALQTQGFSPIIASDGDALVLLQKEFPNLISIPLVGYNIKYSKTEAFFKWVIFKQISQLYRAIKTEKKQIDGIIDKFSISGIISDNRYGVWSNKVPSAFITHQLHVLSGGTTRITSKMQWYLINKFDAIWVPDYEHSPNLSGFLGHLPSLKKKFKITYIGPLSRLTKIENEDEYDVMVLLSGPEPQRSLLEAKLFKTLKTYKGKILFVKGLFETKQTVIKQGQFKIYNYMTTQNLEAAINASKLILCRSGYTTIMDLAALGKKAFFIPTPGQTEQQYLAKLLEEKMIAPYCKQDDFNLNELKKIKDYKGFKAENRKINFSKLFALFKSE